MQRPSHTQDSGDLLKVAAEDFLARQQVGEDSSQENQGKRRRFKRKRRTVTGLKPQVRIGIWILQAFRLSHHRPETSTRGQKRSRVRADESSCPAHSKFPRRPYWGPIEPSYLQKQLRSTKTMHLGKYSLFTSTL